MNMKVVFQDNRESIIDSRLLNEMISVNMIKMFMRSGGWAMVGIDPMRGKGGKYTGPDRRGLYGMADERSYRIIV